MAESKRTNRRTAPAPSAACADHADEIDRLQHHVRALEHECEQLRLGFETLERALRRRGCCDGGGSHRPH